jgi:hypothetical protein
MAFFDISPDRGTSEQVASTRSTSEMSDKERVMESSCICRMENELMAGTRTIRNRATENACSILSRTIHFRFGEKISEHGSPFH